MDDNFPTPEELLGNLIPEKSEGEVADDCMVRIAEEMRKASPHLRKVIALYSISYMCALEKPLKAMPCERTALLTGVSKIVNDRLVTKGFKTSIHNNCLMVTW